MKPELKYLFVAEFADGKKYAQTSEDISQTDPTRNCYYDVLQMVAKGKTIRMFSLLEVGGQNCVQVDLGTGIFYVNGLSLLLESDQLPGLPDKFNLIWYHQVTRDQNVQATVQEDLSIKEERKELPEFREYFIGWECFIGNKRYVQKLAVA